MRRHLVAAAITLHLLAVSLQAMPSPSGGLNRASWADPTVQAEIATWAGRVGATPEAFERRIWSIARAWNGARTTVIRPFRPYYQFAGTSQSWKMFVAPHRFPTRLRIEVNRGQGWELQYAERSAEHRWLAEILDNDRFRAIVFRMGWPHYSDLRGEFAAWVAERAEHDFPGSRQVQISFEKGRTRSPEEVRSGVKREVGASVFRTIAAVPR